ncbi:MAG TPA: IS1595 family transposase [Rhodocyclaceae bacterium]
MSAKRKWKKYKYADGIKGQHIRKTARARDFTTWDVSEMSHEDVFWFLVESRWGSRTEIACPSCGTINKHYFRRTRHQWRCKDCYAYFSLTSGTPFQDRKLPLKKMLLGMVAFIHASNGMSHHELAFHMKVHVKTAQAFVGKLRESTFNDMPKVPLSGTVQIDGGYFGGRPRQGRLRRKKDRQAIAEEINNRQGKRKQRRPRSKIDQANELRKKTHRRTVMVLRELYPEPGMGARRSIVAVCLSENEISAMELARCYVVTGTKIMTDENAAYNCLGSKYDHDTVQHQIEFSTDTGINDNQAESYFSRLRRYVLGVSHRIESKYMMDIAIEMAWRDDVRKMTEGQKLANLAKAVFGSSLSRWWRGYWQGFNRPGEVLFAHGIPEEAIKAVVSTAPLHRSSPHVTVKFSFAKPDGPAVG